VILHGFAQKSENPTDGSRWIVQILSKQTPKNPHSNPTNDSWWILHVGNKVGLEQSTNCRWWDSKLNHEPSWVERILTIHRLPSVGFSHFLCKGLEFNQNPVGVQTGLLST
jgi:hypothetical protein